MKKICLLTMGLAVMTVTAFAEPQTDIQQGKSAVDLGVFNSKTAINGSAFDKNTKLRVLQQDFLINTQFNINIMH